MLSKLAGPGLKGLVSSALAGGAIKRGYDYIGGDTTPAWDSIRQGMMLGVGSKLLGVGNKAAGTWGEVIKDSPVLNALTKVTSGMGNVAGKTANVAGKYAPILGIHYTQSLLDALSTESDK